MQTAVTVCVFLLSILSACYGCIPSERAALLSFRKGLTSDPDGRLSSWHGEDCCRWEGVVCSDITGHVKKLKLRNTFFSNGSSGLGGEISSSLLKLQHLKYLDLSANDLGKLSAPLPKLLGSLDNLRYLNLSNTNYLGRIPPQLGNLSKLSYLDLSSKADSSYYSRGGFSLYSGDLSWLTGLSSLEYLDMSQVNLSAAVGWAQAVSVLPSLGVLTLSNCALTFSGSLFGSNLTRQLRKLDLSSNTIYSSSLGLWSWDVHTLMYLDLSDNGLSGPFPDALGNMTNLEVLRLAENNLTGMIPATLKSLCSLQIVDMSMNLINGSMVEFMKRLPRCALENIHVLHLSNNNLSWHLPKWIGGMSNLTDLDLSNNMLVGEVPRGIGTLTKLTSLSLQYNKFTSSLSEEHFDSLVSLKSLDLSHNPLKMEMGLNWSPPFRLIQAKFADIQMGPPFPTWLKQQENIEDLDISHAGIVDTFPNWFWSMCSNVIYLNISMNQISGRLPSSLRFMRRAFMMFLGSNQFTGSVPLLPELLFALDLSGNSLSGSIPSDLGTTTLLTGLDLSSNKINGPIPASLCEMVGLYHLDLSNNNISGQLPRCRKLPMGLQLRNILLHHNSLSGEFPVFFKHCKDMVFVNLAYNMFSGTIPWWIGRKLPSLTHLQLRSNLFSGDIPTQLTELHNLLFLDLADNNISGSIPHSLATMSGMTKEYKPPLGDTYPYDTLPGDQIWSNLFMVMKGQERAYPNEARYMVSLDLSSNNLGGNIPEELCSLTGLINLNLSYNHLNGTIPRNIGVIQKLESFDLSMNELSGEIPSSISDLTFISWLNLSYNNLSGRIPSGSQLQALANPASIYVGNIGLCGPPLSKNCLENSVNNQGHLEGHNGISDATFFYLSLIEGFIVGLWVVVFALLF